MCNVFQQACFGYVKYCPCLDMQTDCRLSPICLIVIKAKTTFNLGII